MQEPDLVAPDSWAITGALPSWVFEPALVGFVPDWFIESIVWLILLQLADWKVICENYEWQMVTETRFEIDICISNEEKEKSRRNEKWRKAFFYICAICSSTHLETVPQGQRQEKSFTEYCKSIQWTTQEKQATMTKKGSELSSSKQNATLKRL
jgi:hypothetical protein